MPAVSISDPAAFARFYDDALPRIYGYFLHRCAGGSPVAEDLTQETFIAALAELRKGRRVDAPLPWLYGIARHKLFDHYRREARRGTVDAVEEAEVDRLGEDRERVLGALTSRSSDAASGARAAPYGGSLGA